MWVTHPVSSQLSLIQCSILPESPGTLGLLTALALAFLDLCSRLAFLASDHFPKPQLKKHLMVYSALLRVLKTMGFRIPWVPYCQRCLPALSQAFALGSRIFNADPVR